MKAVIEKLERADDKLDDAERERTKPLQGRDTGFYVNFRVIEARQAISEALTMLRDQKPKPLEIRRDEPDDAIDDDRVDEIVGTGFFHLERMSKHLVWMALYPTDLKSERLSWFISSHKKKAIITLQDVPAAPEGGE